MPQYRNGQTILYKPVGGMSSSHSLFSLSPRKFPSNTSFWQKQSLITYYSKHTAGPDSQTSESVGIVRSVLTQTGNQANRNVDASEGQPRYEVSTFFSLPRSILDYS